jgi:hypothetical protein
MDISKTFNRMLIVNSDFEGCRDTIKVGILNEKEERLIGFIIRIVSCII